MTVFKCKMCGGALELKGKSVVTCDYCGAQQTVVKSDDEKKLNLFNRANRLRMDCEFDKAAGVYESIVAEFSEEAEGYWGLCLCKYGIEYVDNKQTGKRTPTCHRTHAASIMDDDDFIQACECAEPDAKNLYIKEAREIDSLQRQIISVVEKEAPYDVFICYKEKDDITKERTEDSMIAQDIYTELIKAGYKVFFSRITLKERAGDEYEPYIYAALKSAKVMIAIGTKYEYYDAVWVKNEWGRFLSMMATDKDKHLIPCYKNLDAYDMPKDFKNLQALNINDLTFLKNLLSNVERFVSKKKKKEEKPKQEKTYTEPVKNGSSVAHNIFIAWIALLAIIIVAHFDDGLLATLEPVLMAGLPTLAGYITARLSRNLPRGARIGRICIISWMAFVIGATTSFWLDGDKDLLVGGVILLVPSLFGLMATRTKK